MVSVTDLLAGLDPFIMRTGIYKTLRFSLLPAFSVLFSCDVDAAPSYKDLNPINPFSNIHGDPAPPPELGPPASAGALRDPAYLPAEIGGIVGSYAVSLVLVAVILLSLSGRRRERLKAGDEVEKEWEAGPPAPTQDGFFPGALPSAQIPGAHFPGAPSHDAFPYPLESPRGLVPNFSYPGPTSPTRTEPLTFSFPSPSLSQGPGVDLAVDQDVVALDRQMAQQQLEDMYKHVMEQEAAKEAGVPYNGPAMPAPPQRLPSNNSTATLAKRGRNKPTSLNLAKEDKTQSRTSSILSALKSPLKKKTNSSSAMSISSPIMTPMSGTFPRYEGEEMASIPPRHYAPAQPPPVPSQLSPAPRGKRMAPITPEISPNSTQSIDERLKSQLPGPHSRKTSVATSYAEPQSAASEASSSPLVAPVGLPSSPKPGSRFPSGVSLPLSPKPGSSFSRSGPPSAIRTGGALPFRQYESGLVSPSAVSTQTKQTTFERVERGPLSPGGGLRTPYTGAAVPYTPYQPFSPVIPMTPSLVTKADRKRMRKFEPKTPTVEMVRGEDEVW